MLGRRAQRVLPVTLGRLALRVTLGRLALKDQRETRATGDREAPMARMLPLCRRKQPLRRLRRPLRLLEHRPPRPRWHNLMQPLQREPRSCRSEQQLLQSQQPQPSLAKRDRMVPWETLALQDLQDQRAVLDSPAQIQRSRVQRDGLDPLVQTQL